MKNILIVGEGNIGKRHIQSILKEKKFNYNIHVIDKSNYSIKKTFNEITEIKKSKKIRIENNFKNLNKEYDLIIIATTSFKREDIITLLLKKTIFKNLILEKIVFQNVSSYKHFIKIFKSKKINCWVNCPNRFYKSYNNLKKLIVKKYPLSMIVSGGNWHFGSNFVHYTDLFCYLINANDLTIDQFEFESEIMKSKRKNFVEFNGLVSLKNNKGNFLTIIHNNTRPNVNIKIIQKNLSFIFNENENFALINRKKNNFSKIDFKIPFQSELTKLYCKEIFLNKRINLPTLENHYKINKNIFDKISNFYYKIKRKNKGFIPIT